MRTLIFNADDYGLSPGVSRGILEAARGVVRATSVMANFITAEQAAALQGSGLSLAAHLNLSTGMPLTRSYPAVLRKPDGSFDKQKALTATSWDDEELCDAAVFEWSFQLERLYALGLPIDHLDSHHHTHMLGPLLERAVDFARQTGLPLRTRPFMREYADQNLIRTPDDFVESFFGSTGIDRDALLAALEQARGDVVEVMCHPGYVDAELRSRSGYLDERQAELELLGSPELAAELELSGWQLQGYQVLSAQR